MKYCPERVEDSACLSLQKCENIIKWLREKYLAVSMDLCPHDRVLEDLMPLLFWEAGGCVRVRVLESHTPTMRAGAGGVAVSGAHVIMRYRSHSSAEP